MTSETSVRRLEFPCGDLSLEGVLHLPASTPAPGVAVCHPHPQYGGDMDNSVVLAACEALVSRGVAALRFNFRGVGDSGGVFDQGKGEQDDVRAALAHLASLAEADKGRPGLVGYSFGAMVAAEVASGDLKALALISPPVGVGDLHVAWGCPALILGGDSDQLAPVDRLKLLAEAPGVELRVFAGADHSWWGHEDELGSALGDFFALHLK